MARKLTITINIENAAFCDDNGDQHPTCAAHECTRILRDLCARLSRDGMPLDGGGPIVLRDSDDNRVGTALVE